MEHEGEHNNEEQCSDEDALLFSVPAQADALAVEGKLEGKTGLNGTTKLVIAGIGSGQIEVEQIAR